MAMTDTLMRFIARGPCTEPDAPCICRALHQVVFFRAPLMPPLHVECHCVAQAVDREAIRAMTQPPNSQGIERFAALPDPDGFLFRRRVEKPAREIGVVALLFGAARLGISKIGAHGYEDIWDYPSVARAIAAAVSWDPAQDAEPDGWMRHHATGRYRVDGDPRREFNPGDNHNARR